MMANVPHDHPSSTPTRLDTAAQSHPSPRSPGRVATDPEPIARPWRITKRIIVCCDGTWQDGIVDKERWQYTNIMRLARALDHVDIRVQPPKPQIVFYQTGIGTSNVALEQYFDGATGASLGEKVEEAYAFIAHNYEPGDEIFLFGFSRGAYTARMVAAFIGEIGVLDRTDMDQFADVFSIFLKRGSSTDSDEIKTLDEQLSKWNSHDSPGKRRADSGPHSFCIKCVAVFDTVGAMGLPKEVCLIPDKVRNLFGFHDTLLGEHIERAYHALALNETRKDFNCTKFEQTEAGRSKGQILKQCWFAGSHSDIGGGYKEHDLSDITLTWMVANVNDILSFNVRYLSTLPNPVAPWGQQPPHDPLTGIYFLADRFHRTMPKETDDVTHETVHPSVPQQKKLLSSLSEDLKKNPNLVCSLLPLEQQVKAQWKVNAEGNAVANARSGANASQKRLSIEASVETVKKIKITDKDNENGLIFKEATAHLTSVAQTVT